MPHGSAWACKTQDLLQSIAQMLFTFSDVIDSGVQNEI